MLIVLPLLYICGEVHIFQDHMNIISPGSSYPSVSQNALTCSPRRVRPAGGSGETRPHRAVCKCFSQWFWITYGLTQIECLLWVVLGPVVKQWRLWDVAQHILWLPFAAMQKEIR